MDDSERIRQALAHLPIFPLPGGVLLPHGLVPLHVFEPRYRKMTRDCEEGGRVLALANIPDEVAAEEKPPRVLPVIGVGVLARVDRLPDGRYNIVLRGTGRARIAEELRSGEPYRLVRAELLQPSLPRSPRILQLADSLKRLVLALSAVRPTPELQALVQLAARARPRRPRRPDRGRAPRGSVRPAGGAGGGGDPAAPRTGHPGRRRRAGPDGLPRLGAKLMRKLPLAALLLLAACPEQVGQQCPAHAVALGEYTMSFAGQHETGECAATQPDGGGVPAPLAIDDGGSRGATLCLGSDTDGGPLLQLVVAGKNTRPSALLVDGGFRFVGHSDPVTGNTACGCANGVAVDETITGFLTTTAAVPVAPQSDGGLPPITGFTATLTDTLSADAGTPGCLCALPCPVTYDITGTRF